MHDDLLMSIVDTIAEGVYFVDADRRITFWSKAAERITGYAASEVTGTRCRDDILRHVDGAGTCLCLDGCPLAAVMGDGRSREMQVWLHHKDGHRVPVHVRGSPIRDEAGRVTGAIEVFADRSDRGQLMEELERLKSEVLTDALTKVGNRRFADMSLETRFHELESHDVPFGAILFDIDHFKSVNDAHGHVSGDRALAMVARSLGGSLRRLDALARWGGEEFLVLAPNLGGGELAALAERSRVLVASGWIDLEGGATLSVTVSGGATMARRGESPADLLARVDALLYVAKETGRNRISTDAAR